MVLKGPNISVSCVEQEVGGSVATASDTHPAGHLPVPLIGAVRITVTGVKGQRSTGLPGKAP